MKKKIFVCAFIAICLSFVAYGTTAYFTYEDKATNVITMGNVKIELQELTIPDSGGDPIPFKDPMDVLPGTDVSKIVQVKNIGVQPAWIRISVLKSILLAEDVLDNADVSLVSYDLNSQYWIEKEGFYYYKEPVNPGKVTEPLFTEVSFSTAMGNMYQESKAILQIAAQATQVIHNGDNVIEAAGWPKAE